MRSRYILIALVLVILAFGVGRLSAAAGTLDSPDVPANTQSYTLEDIYNRLDTGAEDGPSAFTEPAAGPGTETMHDLNDIMAEALVKDNTNGATTADVLTTKTYWSRRTADWGHQTGTMPDNGAVTIVPTTTNQTIALGYHNGSGKVEGDADLVASKIVSDVVIFEVTGSAIAATGDAAVGDVLTGKTFSNDSAAGISGTMPDNGAVTIVPTTTNQAIAAGYHDGSGYVEGDADLAASNIKSGENIFGVAGNLTPGGTAIAADLFRGKTAHLAGDWTLDTGTLDLACNTATFVGGANLVADAYDGAGNGNNRWCMTDSGDAAAGDILKDKKAWVDGSEVTGNVAAGSNVNGPDGSKAFSIPDGLYSGSKTATANDTDLVAGNIKCGVTIFGVTGTVPPDCVAQTGQTTSYATGDDGEYEKGCLPVVAPSSGGSFGGYNRTSFTCLDGATGFEDNGDGTVTDNLTGLIWLKNANCFGTKKWQDGATYPALEAANTLNSGECGLSDGSAEGDWRLPNINELRSLFDPGLSAPYLPAGHPFTGVQSAIYWASTTYAGNATTAWSVYLTSGSVLAGSKAYTYYVWPVRGGQ